jgi:hypothetical protein
MNCFRHACGSTTASGGSQPIISPIKNTTILIGMSLSNITLSDLKLHKNEIKASLTNYIDHIIESVSSGRLKIGTNCYGFSPIHPRCVIVNGIVIPPSGGVIRP